MKARRTLLILAGALFAALVYWFSARYLNFGAAWKILRSLPPHSAFIILTLSVVGNLITVFRQRLILAGLGYWISVWQLFLITIAGNSLSAIIPSADFAARSVQLLLLSRLGVPQAAALIFISIDIFLTALINIGIRGALLLAVGISSSTFGLALWHKILALAGLALFVWAVFHAEKIGRTILPKSISSKEWLRQFLAGLEDARKRILDPGQRRMIVLAAITSIMGLLFSLAEFAATAALMNITPSIRTILLGQTAYFYSSIVPFGGIGALESLLATIFSATGAGYGVALAILIRLRDFFWMVTGSVVLLALPFILRIKWFSRPSE